MKKKNYVLIGFMIVGMSIFVLGLIVPRNVFEAEHQIQSEVETGQFQTPLGTSQSELPMPADDYEYLLGANIGYSLYQGYSIVRGPVSTVKFNEAKELKT